MHATVAVAVAVPLLRSGYLLLLDFAFGPRVVVRWRASDSHLSPVNGAPLEAIIWLLRFTRPLAAFLLVFLLVFAMGYGMNRAIKSLRPSISTGALIVGGTLYAINPFTYTRLVHGHIGILAGMAVLPFVIIALARLRRGPSDVRAIILGVAIAGVGFASLHVFVMLVVLLPMLIVILGRPRLRHSAIASATALVLSSWWLAQAAQAPLPPIGGSDLAPFATVPGGYSAAGHTAALYGFWRVGEFATPRDGVSAWPLTFAPIGLAVLVGALVVWRQRRRDAYALVGVAIVGILLAAGTAFPPSAGAFRFLYETVPGFALFREPQKWVVVVLVAYAPLTAAAADRLLRGAWGGRKPGAAPATIERVVVVAACLAVIGFYGRTMILNFDTMRPVQFPSDWREANRMMSSDGARALAFPWHLYISFPWTGNRITNPAQTFFDVPVVSSDSIEVGSIRSQSRNPESHAVERVLFEEGGHDLLDETLAWLCTPWVILYKTADWESYAWLDAAPSLTRAFDGPTIRLYRGSIPRCT